MSKVVFRPTPSAPSLYRYIVGGRLAWFYPEGTVIEARRIRWVKTEDNQFDSWGWWQREGANRPGYIPAPKNAPSGDGGATMRITPQAPKEGTP